MIRKVISIACFVLAVSACGCQEQNSSNSTVETQNSSTTQTSTPCSCQKSSNSAANQESTTNNTASLSNKNSPTIIAYYFYRTVRCPTCIAIESQAKQIIESSFKTEIADERLMWIPYNLDDTGGEELEKEYDVYGSTLILSKMEDGNNTQYKKLEKVWDLVGNPVKFNSYIQDEVRLFLDE